VTRKGKTKRTATIVLTAGENINGNVALKLGSTGAARSLALKPGTKTVTFNVGSKIKVKQATVVVKLKDASGVSFTTTKKISVPKIIKKKRR